MNIEKLNPNKFQFKALSFEKDETGWCVTLLETESQMKFYIDVWYTTKENGKRDPYLTVGCMKRNLTTNSGINH